jgi:hypothetical protein
VDGTALLLSGLAYVAYVLVGFAMFAVGVAYYAEIKDANQCTRPVRLCICDSGACSRTNRAWCGVAVLFAQQSRL